MSSKTILHNMDKDKAVTLLSVLANKFGINGAVTVTREDFESLPSEVTADVVIVGDNLMLIVREAKNGQVKH